jgi:membrane associated rhomboid family serine protease
MTGFTTEANDARRFRRAIVAATTFVALLWLIQLDSAVFDLNLVPAGIYPRRLSGLLGIALAPLIHASFTHLLANSLPIVVIGTALLYGYPRSTRLVLACLYGGTGLGVWLFGREAYHIGASGLATGMMFFVFTIGALRWDRRAIALSSIVFFLYGGMIWGVFPTDPQVSYESHFFGALLGVALAVVFRNMDPAPPEKRYGWENEEGGQSDSADAAIERGGAEPATRNSALFQEWIVFR